MSFFEILLSGRNEKERRQKRICGIAIVVTAVLLVISLIAFTICMIVDASMNKNDPEDEPEITEKAVDLGETTVIPLSNTAVFTGNLLTLNDNNHYKGEPELVNIYDNRNGAFLSVRTTNRGKFEGTAEMIEKLCDMVTDCNEAINDNNLIVSCAFDSTAISTQKGIYSSGEAVALDCFDENDGSVMHPINEVDKYKWIYNNAHKYGFVAVSAKSNVFRYIGVTHATAAKSKGLSLDAYLKQLKAATPETPMKLNTSGTMIAYYCPISNVCVPKNYSYTTSGDNVNGIIVTVDLAKSTNG